MSIPGSSRIPPPLLVGREREQDVLRDRLAAALAGQGSLVLIGGEEGIGKTALAESLCDAATKRGASRLVGRCYDLTETPPYGPWVDLFGRYRPDDGPSPPAAFARRGTVGEITSQAMLFQQVQDFLMTLTNQRPLVLLLDDLHWADPASLDLLRFIGRLLTTLPLLIIATYRSAELTRRHRLYALLPEFVRESRATRLDLRPLSGGDVHELIRGRYHLSPADTSRLLTYLQARAEGNPLFLGELLRTLEEDATLRPTRGSWAVGDLMRVPVPPLLRQVIDRRLARLGQDAQDVLGIAAMVGHEVPLAVMESLADVDEEVLLTVVEQAVEARLLIETADGAAVRFGHPMIREAVYEGLSPTPRRLMHRRIGELLAAQSQPDPDAVAQHFQRAGDGRAAEWLVRAGEHAQQAYAWVTAADRYEAALALLESSEGDIRERGWLRYRIARLRRWSNPSQGIENLDHAERLALAVGDRALAAAALYARGLCRFYAGSYERAIDEMRDGTDALERLPPADQARLELQPGHGGVPAIMNPRGMLVIALATSGRIAEAVAMGERVVEIIPPVTTLGELGWSHYGDREAGLGFAYAYLGKAREAREAFVRARKAFLGIENYATFCAAAIWEQFVVSLPYFPERAAENRQLAAEVENAAMRAGTTGDTFPRIASLPLLALAGKWTEARADALTVLGPPWLWKNLARIVLGILARAQGEPKLAWAQVYDVLPDGPGAKPGTRDLFYALASQRLAAALALDADDLAGAREWLEANDRWLSWSGAALGRSEGHALWARFYQASSDHGRTYQHARQALALASEPRQPLALLAAHRLLGELDTDAGRYRSAELHLNASLALADTCRAPYERALTLLARADLRAAANRRAEVGALLDEVRAICTPLNSRPALARADALAARLASPSVGSAMYPDGLTAREVDVLRLIATGSNNQEIADTLSLSIRTVERHITNLYGKIAARGRADATTYALSHGLA